jgi:phage terminase large subunit
VTTQVAELLADSGDPFAICVSQYSRAPNAFWREVLGLDPDPWQETANRALAHGHKRLSIRSGHGVGKAEPVSNWIDTPDGRRRWGDLAPGDRLFGRDGEVTHIVACHDQGVRPMFRVTFDDGTSCRVCAEHLWTVRGRAQRRVDRVGGRSGEFVTLTTAELLAQGVKRRNGAAEARQWELPRHGAAQYPWRDVPIPSYLLGAALGDGVLNNTGLLLHGSAEKAAHWSAACSAAAVSHRVTDRGGGDRVSVYLHRQIPALRTLGLAAATGSDKFVPVDYKENAPAMRLALLQGLMDADGTCAASGVAVYTSVSRRLADDVAWLVRSLGGKAFVGEAQPSHYTKDGQRIRVQDHYDVTVRMPPGMDPFTLPSKAVRLRPCQDRYLTRWIDGIEPDGEEAAMCVTVDAADGLYLADDFIVTHNSVWVAGTVTWFVCTRAPHKVGITAPSAPQLFDALFAELKSMLRRLPPAWADLFEIQESRVELKAAPDECFISARTSRKDNPESLQGLHSHNMLLCVDEASGVDEAVFEAAGGSMSSPNAITVLTGNPTRATGFFWRTHVIERDRWFCMRVSCVDSPRVDRAFIDEIAGRYGEDSNQFRIRVLGEFPTADEDTVIPAGLVDAAMARDVAPNLAVPEIWGLDVARFGADSSVLVKRRGNKVTEMPRRWTGVDTMGLAGAVKAEFDMLPPPARPALIVIDVIGIGSGVVDRLIEQNLPVLGLNVGETPSVAGRFVRMRDELWIRAREWLEARNVSLPYDERLRADLAGPRLFFMSDGRMQVESKTQMRSRGLPSPDAGDALVQTFAPGGMALQLGMGGLLNPRIPLRRVIAGTE